MFFLEITANPKSTEFYQHFPEKRFRKETFIYFELKRDEEDCNKNIDFDERRHKIKVFQAILFSKAVKMRRSVLTL